MLLASLLFTHESHDLKADVLNLAVNAKTSRKEIQTIKDRKDEDVAAVEMGIRWVGAGTAMAKQERCKVWGRLRLL